MTSIKRIYIKFKSKKFKIFLLVMMYTVLFSVIWMLLLFGGALEKQARFITDYIESEVAISPTGKPVYADTVNEIRKAECIREYNVYCAESVRLQDCDPVIPDLSLYHKMLEEKQEKAEKWGQAFDPENIADASIVETNNSKNLVFFLQKGFVLQQGRHIQEEDRNAALISAEFAGKNGLGIGDTFRTMPRKNDRYYGGKLNQELEVIGIYEHGNHTFYGSPGEYYSNCIFTSIGPVSQSYMTAYEKMTVFLKEGADIDDLKGEIAEKSLYLDVNNYSFTSSGEWADLVSGPFESMQDMSRLLLTVMLVSVVIIIMMIGAFYIRENLYEMGILLSLGGHPLSVVLHMVMEECVPLLLGAVFSVLIGIGCVDKAAGLVDQRYIAELDQIIEQKNEELSESMYASTDIMAELRTLGQVMRMETEFTLDYTVTWHEFMIFVVMVMVGLPFCFCVQLYCMVKCLSIRQILL